MKLSENYKTACEIDSSLRTFDVECILQQRHLKSDDNKTDDGSGGFSLKTSRDKIHNHEADRRFFPSLVQPSGSRGYGSAAACETNLRGCDCEADRPEQLRLCKHVRR